MDSFASDQGEIVTRWWKPGNFYYIRNPDCYITGYARIKYMNMRYLAHRLVMDAWHPTFKLTDNFIDYSVDHINAIRSDNRPSNLRVMSLSDNVRDMRLRVTSKLDICENIQNSSDIIWD